MPSASCKSFPPLDFDAEVEKKQFRNEDGKRDILSGSRLEGGRPAAGPVYREIEIGPVKRDE